MTMSRGRRMSALRGERLSRRRIWMTCRGELMCLVVRDRGRYSCRMKGLAPLRERRVRPLMRICAVRGSFVDASRVRLSLRKALLRQLGIPKRRRQPRIQLNDGSVLVSLSGLSLRARLSGLSRVVMNRAAALSVRPCRKVTNVSADSRVLRIRLELKRAQDANQRGHG